MSYTKTYKEGRYEPISAALEELKVLEPGQRIVLACASGESAGKTRLLIYDWLHHTGLKAQFKIRTLGTAEIMVQRLEGGPLVARIEQVDSRISPFVEQLIEAWGLPEAEGLMAKWVSERVFSEAEAEELWKRVEKIMS